MEFKRYSPRFGMGHAPFSCGDEEMEFCKMEVNKNGGSWYDPKEVDTEIARLKQEISNLKQEMMDMNDEYGDMTNFNPEFLNDRIE